MERTWNMSFMVVSLEVSRLSGWLKANAPCQVKGRGMRCGARCAPEGGRVYEAVVAQAACTGKARDSRLLGARARAERTVNMNCMFVTLEVSRLSG